MRVLIRKTNSSNTLVSAEVLIENEDLRYEIIENAPVIEDRPNEIGNYELNEAGELVVVYKTLPPTVEEKLEQQEQIIADLMLEIAELRKQGGN